MSRYPSKLFKAHDTDPPAKIFRVTLGTNKCIHCNQLYKNGEKAMYTRLSNSKLIWWHIDPSCTPDPIEELQ